MKSLVVYDSQYGNTEDIAEALADEFGTAGPVQLINVRATQWTAPEPVDLLVVGGPTQVHQVSPSLRAQLDALPAHCLMDVQLATFDTRVHGPQILTGAASHGIAKALKKRGARLVVQPESFIVTAKEGPLAPGELARAHKWAQQLLAKVAPTLAATVAVT